MHDLKQALAEAEQDGIVSQEQRQQITALFIQRGLLAAEGGVSAFAGLDRAKDADPPTPAEESESPRFVRGFHDILITIGVLAALIGLWGFAGPFAVLPAILILAEILIVRQRLALPAFTLTLAFLATVVSITLPFVEELMGGQDTPIGGFLFFLVQPLVLVPFFWRYRVPAALALIILSAVAAVFMLVLAGISASRGLEDIMEAAPLTVASLALTFAVILFAVAMAFDMGDPRRVTRRSDVAFWLHLGVAPILLYSFYAVLTMSAGGGWVLQAQAGLNEALLAMIVVAVLMLTGIVIDRRAFVTSGLISLGAAIVVLAREADIDMTSFATLPVFAVGLVVLTLGIGWQRLRAWVLGVLPQAVVKRVPPAVV